MLSGCRPIGQAARHLPQRMQVGSSAAGAASTMQSTAFVPFTTGTERSPCAVPIIGPPQMTLQVSSFTPPAASRSSPIGVPTRTIMFFGSTAPSPVTVTTFSVMGRPSYTARQMEYTVVTLKSAPVLAPGATSRPVTARIICFLAP